MGSFPSWFRAAPLVRVQRPASVFAVGRRVYVASAGDGLTHVALTDDAGADARTHLTDGTEVEILAWRPRKFDGTRYRVRVTREGFEGWLAGDNLRSTRVAISAPMEPPPATESVPRAMDPGDAGRRFGQRAS